MNSLFSSGPSAIRRPLTAATITLVLLLAGQTSLRAQELPRSAPEEQGIASDALLEVVRALDDLDAMNSFMLVRHGHVVVEGWWRPYDRDVPHSLYSLSKSFTSTAVGLAVSEGLMSVDDEVLSFFPDEAPPEPEANLRAMRVRDLLRMSTGHQQEVALDDESEWTRAFLSHPVPHKPGTHFLYNTPATYVLSAIVQRAAGETVLDFLKPRLFEPLGIQHPHWGMSPEGVTLGGYGLSLRTEDIARFGQLYLARGAWNGQQLLPASWVEEATTLQTSNGSHPSSDWDQGYGYQFWRSRYGNYRGDGAFGQYCIILPKHDAVVAITSGVRDMQTVMNIVWEKLMPAMGSEALPRDDSAYDRLLAALEELEVRPVSGDVASPVAPEIAGRVYRFPPNVLGADAISINADARMPSLTLHSAGAQRVLPFAYGGWATSSAYFENAPDRPLGLTAEHRVALSGGWTADDVLTLKLCFYETPFYLTMHLRFDSDQVIVDSEMNVGFAQRGLTQLIGVASTGN